jgi:esterase/lipase
MKNNNSKICFVLLPGFAPDYVQVLGLRESLKKHGFDVVASSFFGNTDIDDFSHLTAEDCIENISKIIDEASEKYDLVFGIGISIGGALLLENAKNNNNIKGVVSIGTPFRLKHRKLIRVGQKICPVIHPLWNQLQKYKKLRLLPIGAGDMIVNYLEGKFLENLNSIEIPALFLHSKEDKVTDYKALSEFVPKLLSTNKKIIFFDNGNHVIGYNSELIIKNALSFFELL